jgi:hypothetical protein
VGAAASLLALWMAGKLVLHGAPVGLSAASTPRSSVAAET